MPPMTVGCPVRVYYDEETFDEGEVKEMTETHVFVDFYDWIERWTADAQFVIRELYSEHKAVWVPVRPGVLVMDFRLTNKAKLL